MRSFYSAAAAIFILVCDISSASAQRSDQSALKWLPWFEIGRHVASDRSRTEAALWLPVAQSKSSVFFADLRGKLFEEDQAEGNLAFGYRQMLGAGWNVGGWLGFDRRRTAFGSLFDQVAFGIEALHPRWEVRANAYVPLESERVVAQSQSTSFSTVAGTPTLQLGGGDILLVTDTLVTASTVTSQTKEVALRGFDAEAGYKLPWRATGLLPPEQQEFRLYGGGFLFEHKDLDRVVAGPKFRAEWRVNDVIPGWAESRLTLEGQYRWDELRGHQQEVGLKLRLPFGQSGPSRRVQLSAQERLMAESVHRDTDIATQTKSTSSVSTTQTASQSTERVADAMTGVTFNRAVVVTNGSDLQSALTLAGGNSLVIAQGGSTSFGRISLLDSQTLVGGGSTIQVRGVISGIVVDFTAPGSRPLIAYAGPATNILGGSAVVSVASNTHLVGVDITGGGNAHTPNAPGVFGGDNLTNVVVERVRIYSVGDQGVQFGSGNSNIRILDNSIANIGSDGIAFQFNNSNILVAGNTLDSTNFDGIVFQGGNVGIRIIDNKLSNIGDDAIGGMGNNQIEYSRNVFSGRINQNLLDIFLTNGNAYSGSGNVLSPGLVVGGRLCEASPGPSFTGSFSFTDGTVFRDNVAPCN